MLECKDISLSIDGKILFQNFSCRIDKGKVLGLMAPSGSGKTSFIHFVVGHLPQGFTASGDVFLYNRNILELPSHLRRLGLVSQKPLLFPHFNVFQNLHFALPSHTAKKERKNMVEEIANHAKCHHLLHKNIHYLSGGEAARISLLRTLLSDPQALLLDEPFSSLDEKTKESFQDFLYQTIKERKLPTLCVTHHKSDIAALHGDIMSF